ncbi:MAG: hypothetical protein FGM63_06205 [Candidatus Nanopelagicaceae bacterium]|nr:hypothetical protein [Candidatus Nanopelagicaceae bacterium]
MIQLAIENQRDNSNSKDGRIDYYRRKIELESIFHGGFGLEALKLIDPTSSDSRCSSRISARAISSSDYVALFKIKPTHFALVDGTAVVATRSGRSESLNLSLLSFPIVGNDAHGVTGLDFLNILPPNHVTSERINDDESFVVENHRGMKKELVGKSATKCAPDRRYEPAGEAVVKEVYVGQGAEKKEAQEGKKIRAGRPEELAICHEDIFSRATEMRAA